MKTFTAEAIGAACGVAAVFGSVVLGFNLMIGLAFGCFAWSLWFGALMALGVPRLD